MSDEWGALGWGAWPVDSRLPGVPLDEESRVRASLPRTLVPVPGEGVVQRPVFDPALLHYAKAMRAGDPGFADEETAAAWYAARAAAFGHVLAAVAESPWSGDLMLRGSFLLSSWFGPEARPPGDLDFVVLPRSWRLADRRTGLLFDRLARDAEERSHRGGAVRLSAEDAVSDEIWTYDRVPGRRLVLRWRDEGLPSGAVQLDFTFGERLPSPPVLTEVPVPGEAGSVTLLAASPEQSLAWKILWLVTDMHPQAKDVYDAALLAEVVSPDGRLLRETFVASDTYYAAVAPKAEELAEAVTGVDWDEFRKEYPGFPFSAERMRERLPGRLAEVLAERVDPPGGEYERRAAWLAPHIIEYRTTLAARGRDGVVRSLADERIRLIDAALIFNEVRGRPPGEVEASARELLEHPDWPHGEVRYYGHDSKYLEAELASLRG